MERLWQSVFCLHLRPGMGYTLILMLQDIPRTWKSFSTKHLLIPNKQFQFSLKSKDSLEFWIMWVVLMFQTMRWLASLTLLTVLLSALERKLSFKRWNKPKGNSLLWLVLGVGWEGHQAFPQRVILALWPSKVHSSCWRRKWTAIAHWGKI